MVWALISACCFALRRVLLRPCCFFWTCLHCVVNATVQRIECIVMRRLAWCSVGVCFCLQYYHTTSRLARQDALETLFPWGSGLRERVSVKSYSSEIRIFRAHRCESKRFSGGSFKRIANFWVSVYCSHIHLMLLIGRSPKQNQHFWVFAMWFRFVFKRKVYAKTQFLGLVVSPSSIILDGFSGGSLKPNPNSWVPPTVWHLNF